MTNFNLGRLLPSRLRGSVRAGLSELGRGALELAWPTRCVGCDAPGTLLCDACRASLPAIDQTLACPRCGAPFGALVCTECTDCREHGRDDDPAACTEEHAPDALSGLAGVACYGVLAWPLDAAVRAYKDAGERRVAALLAGMCAQAVRASAARTSAFGRAEAVTFVPATPRAFARRGYDHMELVARSLAGRLGLPLLDALTRADGSDQRELGRDERLAAAGEGWRVVADVAGARLLLADDVLTTGATLGGAARALLAAGALEVCGVVAARAW